MSFEIGWIRQAPAVSITLRNLPLKRVLDFIVDSVGYQYEVQADAVVEVPCADIASGLDVDRQSDLPE